ncbi:mRNA splicing protein [Gonapodya sp. JEL0774]|nr:mRNA splicing protein [Gonapodya sp. JEL0774]
MTTKLSREEFRRQKDLEAARKAGTAPAEVDEDTGKDINPHIPQYISAAPWYIDSGKVSLSHQRNLLKKVEDSQWYERGLKIEAPRKFRKGACENCGSMTHKTKECMERPRKLGAKWTGKDISADEVIQEVETTWDGKRDRWNGYDPSEHMRHIEEFELVDQERKKARAADLEQKLKAGEVEQDDVEESLDEDKYAEQADMPGQKMDAKTRTTIRNLRIREDTAKYLRNLSLESAHYDPKTRSMRDNPYRDREQDPSAVPFAGDNFVRYSGDVTKMNQLQLFAWEAAQRAGGEVHVQSNPTQADLLYREFQQKKEKVKDTVKESILDRYGGVEHLQAPPKELLLAQTENYVEYSRTGRVIKGQERAKVKSRYLEDTYLNNHTTVWGSWWSAGKWGYACCHSNTKNSYCTGESGKEAARMVPVMKEDSERKTLQQQLQQSSTPLAPPAARKRKAELGEGDIELDQSRLAAALKEEERRKKSKVNEREQGYQSGSGHEVTEEELEAYRRLRQHGEDPLAGYVDAE